MGRGARYRREHGHSHGCEGNQKLVHANLP
jgi:hypothetical protein